MDGRVRRHHRPWCFAVSALLLLGSLVCPAAQLAPAAGTMKDPFKDVQPPMKYEPYNSTLSEVFARYSGAAYCAQPVVQQWICKVCSDPGTAGFQVLEVLHNATTDSMAFVGYLPKEAHPALFPDGLVVVSFRGTASIQNWLLDFTVGQIPFLGIPNVHVHSGFYYSMLALRTGVWSNLKKAAAVFADSPRPPPIAFTGHSLGSATSLLCALEFLADNNIRPLFGKLYFYDYGQPRVGNVDFAVYSTGQIPDLWRVVHALDIVPHVPLPVDGGYGYLHGGKEVWYPKSTTTEIGNYQLCHVGEDLNCSDGKVALSLKDHLWYMGLPIAGGLC